MRLAAEGASVAVTDIDDDMGAETVALIEQAGGTSQFMSHDVTDEAAWEDVVAKTVAGLDVLVNNAGIAIGGSIIEMELADWQRQQAINLDGVFLGTNATPCGQRWRLDHQHVVGRRLRLGPSRPTAQRRRRAALHQGVALVVLNQWKVASIRSPRNHRHRSEQDQSGDADRGSPAARSRDAGHDGRTRRRHGHPENIADAVLFLASDDSAYVTGTEVVVDGGLSA